MNAAIPSTNPAIAACARCGTALVPDGLFCSGCGLPAGFHPVSVPPLPLQSWQRRALGIVLGVAGFLTAVAGFVAIMLAIANNAMSGSGGGDDGDLRAITFSPDGKQAIAASRQGRVTVWDTSSGYPIRTLDTGDRGVVALTPVGWTVATGARAECGVTLWDLRTGTQQAQLLPATKRSRDRTGTLAVAIAPDGGRVAAGCQDGSVTVWEVAAGRPLATVEASRGELRALAFAPDGNSLYSGGADRIARRWSLPDGTEQARFTGLQDTVISLAPTRDGARLIGATDGVRGDQRIVVWDVGNGNEVGRLGWDKGMAPVALSPDGSLLAATSLGSIIVIERVTSAAVRTLSMPGTAQVAALAFTPDGRRLAAVGEDRTAMLWDPATGSLIRRLRR